MAYLKGLIETSEESPILQVGDFGCSSVLYQQANLGEFDLTPI